MGYSTQVSTEGVGLSSILLFASQGSGGPLYQLPPGLLPAFQTAVTGTVTYNVEVTLDNSPSNTTGNWAPFSQNGVILGSAQTGNLYYGISSVFTAMRINQTAGTGSVLLNLGIPYSGPA